MERELLRWRPLQLAAIAVVLALALTGVAAMRAAQLALVPDATPPTFPSADAIALAAFGPPVDVRAVVALNAFSPERTAPARRYSITGYTDPRPAPDTPQPEVLGTAIAPDPAATFAMCRVGNGPVLVMRVGGTIGGYTVRAIERYVVTFVSPTGEQIQVRSNQSPAPAARSTR